jgi:Skp family chaperone for outer membrane proteins
VWRLAFLCLVLLLAAGLAPRVTVADDRGPSLDVAVVDFARVRRMAEAARGINDQAEKLIAAYQTDIEKEEQGLRLRQEDLDRRRSTMSEAAFAEERHTWEQEVAEAQRRFQRRRQDMDKARADAWRQMNDALDQVISDIVVERKLVLVLRRDQTVAFAPSLDITEEVLRRLNGILPNVPIAVPNG